MLDTLARNDRLIVRIGLIAVTAVSWAYLLAGAGMNMDAAMTMPEGMNMMAANALWSPGYTALIFTMWWVMMMAMMLPSAAPMILLFSAVNRGSAKSSSRAVPTFVFAIGYAIVWGSFCVIATALQWMLASSLLLDTMMQSTSQLLSGAILLLAGAYQFLPVKDACLRNCQTPMQFVMAHWAPGHTGALRMGILHGTVCLGCCWFLMALLFFGGVMNLIWIGGLALYVLIEKLAPAKLFISKITGGILIVWGITTVLAI